MEKNTGGAIFQPSVCSKCMTFYANPKLGQFCSKCYADLKKDGKLPSSHTHPEPESCKGAHNDSNNQNKEEIAQEKLEAKPERPIQVFHFFDENQIIIGLINLFFSG